MCGGIVVAYKLEDVDIDKKKTASNVRKFFAGEFLTYLSRAGLHSTDLSSANLDPTGIASRGKNSAESNIMKIFDYEAKCGAVYRCAQDCRENENLGIYNRKILIYRYFQNIPDGDVKDRLGISSTAYAEKKLSALIDFADRLPVWAYKFDTKLPELREFKNEELE